MSWKIWTPEDVQKFVEYVERYGVVVHHVYLTRDGGADFRISTPSGVDARKLLEEFESNANPQETA